jgi:cell division protein FtsN
MAPVLLDQRSLFRAGIAVSLTMLVVFFTGYYTGYHKADFGRGMGLNKTIALALPGPAHAETTEYEPHLPQAQIPGANIDVDSPDHKAAATLIEKQAVTQVHQAEAEVETVINETTSLIGKPAASDVSSGQDNQRLQLASLAITPGIIEPDNKAGAIEAVDDKRTSAEEKQQFNDSTETVRKIEITDTASAEDARYTIQVGVFADSENAIRRMSELESHNLSTYTNGYTHKRDAFRFNVRFGYFRDKSSAVAALTSFQQNLSGSGYVTRIRRN